MTQGDRKDHRRWSFLLPGGGKCSECLSVSGSGLSPAGGGALYPLVNDLDRGEIWDGGAEDNYFLHPFQDVRLYSRKTRGVRLEWPQYTPGRAAQLIDYVQKAVRQAGSAELWKVWLSDGWEEDRPSFYCIQVVL